MNTLTKLALGLMGQLKAQPAANASAEPSRCRRHGVAVAWR
ncbi:MAG: hypothetical protein ABI702_05365 [Burkholderiales bacterium]